jgi:chemosensory pili system protein ChpA (sensor histidine kinase/response regulator)
MSMPGIILADHDTQYASILRRRFEMDGIPFFFLSDGKSLCSLARSVQPNAVLCSLRIGCVDGFETIREFRQDHDLKAVPCIIITDLADSMDIHRCRALGCSAYFIKRHTKPEHLFAYLRHSGYLESASVSNPAYQTSLYAII